MEVRQVKHLPSSSCRCCIQQLACPNTDSARVLFRCCVLPVLVLDKRSIYMCESCMCPTVRMQHIYACPVPHDLPMPVVIAVSTQMERKFLDCES